MTTTKPRQVTCPDCTTGRPSPRRPWFRANCPTCDGTGAARDLTTDQAAEQLGISPQRVRQFLQQGRLIGRKHGREWLVNILDVRRFAAQPRPPGNPKLVAGRRS